MATHSRELTTMTDASRLALQRQLVQHEGLRKRLYRCSAGKLTIGVGYNIDDRGLGPLSKTLGRPVTLEELDREGLSSTDALKQLDADIDDCVIDLVIGWPWFIALDVVRQRVLVDMRFNLGPTKFRQFTGTLAAVARGDYATAAARMQASKWYRDVKTRGETLVRWMRTGSDL